MGFAFTSSTGSTPTPPPTVYVPSPTLSAAPSSRRPLELDNVFNQEQVSIVLREREELELPDFDDIYAADMVSLPL